jgi:thiol-disulfide isomerase/thioredoxin
LGFNILNFLSTSRFHGLRRLFALSIVIVLFAISSAKAENALGVAVGTSLKPALDELVHAKPDKTQSKPVLELELGSLALKDLDGDELKSTDIADKKVMLFFWSLHCRGCVSMLKEMQSMQEELEDSNVEVLTIHLFEPKQQTISDFVEKLGLNLPILLAPKSVRELFSVRLLPTSLVFDKNRRLVARFDGELSKDELKLTLTGRVNAASLESQGDAGK